MLLSGSESHMQKQRTYRGSKQPQPIDVMDLTDSATDEDETTYITTIPQLQRILVDKPLFPQVVNILKAALLMQNRTTTNCPVLTSECVDCKKCVSSKSSKYDGILCPHHRMCEDCWFDEVEANNPPISLKTVIGKKMKFNNEIEKEMGTSPNIDKLYRHLEEMMKISNNEEHKDVRAFLHQLVNQLVTSKSAIFCKGCMANIPFYVQSRSSKRTETLNALLFHKHENTKVDGDTLPKKQTRNVGDILDQTRNNPYVRQKIEKRSSQKGSNGTRPILRRSKRRGSSRVVNL